MAIVVTCSALCVLGAAAAIRWGALEFREAPEGGFLPRYVWHVAVTIWTALLTGLLVIGPGGRLAMRILAVTAGPAAQGRITEADQVVGKIMLEGTLSFAIFNGLFFGTATAGLYMLLRHLLPRGYWSGLAFAGLLLAAAATRTEPLRPGNKDFDIVGPGWVSIVIFAALAILQGVAVAALAARLSRVLPLPNPRRPTIVAYVPLLLLIPVFPAALAALVIGLVAYVVQRVGWRLTPRALTAGRAVLLLVVAAALPGFVSAISSIASRGSQ